MAENLPVKSEKKEVVLTGGLALQDKLLSELEKASQEFGTDLTPYGKKCAVNCIAGIVMFCKQNDIDISKLDPTLLRLQIQNVAYTELNFASIPSEIYFDIRKSTDSNGEVTYSLTIKPQGAGNEKLVRKYGVGLKQGTGLHNAILIREGDEFIMPQFNGLEVSKPVYRPKLENANNKVIAVMYPAEKEDGSVEYLIATRDSVKANLIAQIRQNTMYAFKKIEEYEDKFGNKKTKEVVDKEVRDQFYAHVDELAEKMTVDEMLCNEELLTYINPTYTSGGSKEAMILRKMKNNALKNYPKEYDNSIIAESVKEMFEEQDKTVLERKNVVGTVEAELDEDLNDDVVEDFTADEAPKETAGTETPASDTSAEDSQEEDLPF